MKTRNTQLLFYYSLGIGIFIWVLMYVIMPIEIVEPLKGKTITIVALSYLALVVGFNTIKFNNKDLNNEKKVGKLFFNVLLTIIALSFIIRWVDLFYLRGVSFGLEPKENRMLNYSNITNSGLFFFVASIIKSLYFFPFAIYSLKKSKRGLSLLQGGLSVLILVFPLVESYFFGTRKPIIEIIIILAIIFLIKGQIRWNIRTVVISLFTLILFLFLSGKILYERELKKNESIDKLYEKMISASYNDFAKPNEWVTEFVLNKNNPNVIRMASLVTLQSGQYIVHGLFEFNNIVDKEIQASYGGYTFYPFKRLFRILKDKDYVYPENELPRKIVYLSAFGGLYVDFKWFVIPFFFFFGMLQRRLFYKAEINYLYTPILIYLLIINLFLPIMNYLRGSGVYVFVAFGIVLTIDYFFEKLANEKSPSS